MNILIDLILYLIFREKDQCQQQGDTIFIPFEDMCGNGQNTQGTQGTQQPEFFPGNFEDFEG